MGVIAVREVDVRLPGTEVGEMAISTPPVVPVEVTVQGEMIQIDRSKRNRRR
jgi:hypothetical protein